MTFFAQRLRMARACLLGLLGLSSLACVGADPTRPSAIADAANQSVADGSRPRTMDDEYEALVDSIPGFGGWYIDDNNNPTVVLVDTSRRAVAEQRLRPRIEQTRRGNRTGRQIIAATLRVQRGSYDFKQLRGWAKVAERLMDSELDAVYVDANEGTNRVEVGVSSISAAGRISNALIVSGVPEQAYDVKVTQPARNLVDIWGRIRPIPGGVIIRYGILGVSSTQCTGGFNVSLSFSGPIGFVTNAHCTPVFGSVSTVDFWQHADASSNKVGEEILDPSPWQNTSDCTSWRNSYPAYYTGVCRYSDAAISDYRSISPDSVDFGYIARTLSRAPLNTAPGSTAINPSNPHFEIASKLYSIPQGTYLDRLGSGGAGWTIHNVSHTCTTIIATTGTGSGYKKMWCQYKTGGGSTAYNGDSGGPLWTYDYCDNGQLTRPDGTACISLAGILWGGDGDERLFFSPIQNIEWDFGITFGVRPADKP